MVCLLKSVLMFSQYFEKLLFRVQVSTVTDQWNFTSFLVCGCILILLFFCFVFNWKWKSCRDSFVAGVGSWEVGNDIQPVCSSGNGFHSNLGLPRIVTSPYGEHFLTYTFARKAHQSRVNCKEGFWVLGKPFSLLGQWRCGTGAQKKSVLSFCAVFQALTG